MRKSAVYQVLLRQIAEYFLQPVPCLCISLFRGLHVPLRSLALILLNAFAIVVQITKAFLRCGNALLSGFPVPLRGLLIILPDTLSAAAGIAKGVLRVSIALLGSLPEPFRGLFEVLPDALSAAVCEA